MANAFLRYAAFRARRYVDQNRHLVEVLAKTLLDRRVMSGPAVRRVLRDEQEREFQKSLREHPMPSAES